CYVLDVPEGHRFPMRKYALLKDQILHEGIVTVTDFFEPRLMAEDTILLAHDEAYWNRTKRGEWTRQEERRSGFPWSEAMIARERVIMQGTLDCAERALGSGTVALNIAGGTHHAYADRAEGFCILNDFAIAAKHLLHSGRISRALILDCDVHQGNGSASILANEKRVTTFSMHGASNYPLHKESSDVDVPLPDGTRDESYLELLSEHLDRLLPLNQDVPDIVFYQCGVDILETDKLGKLSISIRGCMERDRLVLERCASLGIPVVCAMGGGYSPDVNTVVQAHVNTFSVALDAWT
ncbi:MAG: histone deacetylase, partial [Flavobacteriales bacterium]